MKSLYMWWARRGSNKEEWMSTHTDGCCCLKSSGSSVYGIRWNHMSFMGRALLAGWIPRSIGMLSWAWGEGWRPPPLCNYEGRSAEPTPVLSAHGGSERVPEQGCFGATRLAMT